MAQRVLVVGLRATGAVVVHWLRARGDAVTVVEERPGQAAYAERRAAAEAAGVTVIEGSPDWSALLAATDLMVPSPGVVPRHPAMLAAVAAGVVVRGDLDLAVEAAKVPVVVVTGTNGKSTVTTLISAMLEAAGMRAPAVGNIGRVALDAVESDAEILVIEASSFQLHSVTDTFAPAVAVLLNLADDHLDWHGSFGAYVEAKRNAFRHQRPTDVLVADLDDPLVAELASGAPGRVVGVTATGFRPGAISWTGLTLVDERGSSILELDETVRMAPHELANIAAAAAAARVMAADAVAIDRAVRGFTRLHHRTELVGKAGGVEYVDDSKATNPHATLAAVRGYSSVVLLAGGDSKGVDLVPLASVADRLRGVVTIGDTPEEIEAALGAHVPTVRAASMRAAVRQAAAMARPADVVLLSPACASFDWYSSYSERGDDFRREVEALLAEGEMGPNEMGPNEMGPNEMDPNEMDR
ncbi:MAG: UDP-N-acetylmuramoyl-L-alanine--D-glutamate ligase [Acidimicrobiia bacterium]